MKVLYAVVVLSTLAFAGCGAQKVEQPVDDAQGASPNQQGSDSKDTKDKPAEGSGY